MAYQTKPRWTRAQEDFLLNNYEDLTDEEIAVILQRTLKSIRRKRERMGLPKASGRGICMARVQSVTPPADDAT